MTELTNLLTQMENHGISFVVTAGMLFFLFRIANVFYQQFEQKMISHHSQKLKEHWTPTIGTNTQIHNILYKTLSSFGADKATIYQYHNGGYNISGIPFLKASNTIEVSGKGTLPSTQVMMQNLPIGVYAYQNKQVLSKSIAHVSVSDIGDEDQSAQQVLLQNGIKSLIIVGMYDTNQYPLGFFCLEYATESVAELTDQQITELKVSSAQIAGLIS